MLSNGFIKVSAVTPILKVGNPKFNIEEIIKSLDDNKSSIVVFPELSITGYSCQDLFYSNTLINEAYEALEYFLNNNKHKGIIALGMPVINEGSLFNAAIIIKDNKILGVVPKRSLPNTNEFYEKRWFKPAYNSNLKEIYINGNKYPFGNLIFTDNKNNLRIGVEICEDMWSTVSPGNIMALNGCNIILNLSASNEVLGKSNIRRASVIESSRKNNGAYVYASAGVYESTSDTVFSGHDIIASCGEIIKEDECFNLGTTTLYGDIDLNKINYSRKKNSNFHDNIHISFDYQNVLFELENSKDFEFEDKLNQNPFIPTSSDAFDKINKLQEFALIKRIKSTNSKSIVIGVSGGLDSTLALLVSVNAFKRIGYDLKNIIAVTMPGFGTSGRTKNNAFDMMKKLGVTLLEKSIVEDVTNHFKTIEHDINVHDVTYENAQARYRTMILMDLANKYNGFVIGTGDLSELALGWCTYNGDQMSMYGINGGIPKTLVRYMVYEHALNDFKEIKDTLIDICETPISPELASSSQLTEDSVGKYEINDFILYHFLYAGDDMERIKFKLKKAYAFDDKVASDYVSKFFKRFFQQQFKRQALPDGPKILEVSLSPRGDYRMPSDIER